MCGIAGAFGGGILDERERRAVAAMWRASEARGRDAAGLFGFDYRGQGCMVRRIGRASDMIDARIRRYGDAFKLPNAVVLVCHTRLASMGDKTDIKNAHPFRHGNVVGMHNGTVPNARDFVDPSRLCGGTDSEAIILALAERAVNDPLDAEMVSEVCGKLDGSFALALADLRAPHRLFLVGSPMAWVLAGHTVFFASTMSILARGLTEGGIKIRPKDLDNLDPFGGQGIMLTARDDAGIDIEWFDVPRVRRYPIHPIWWDNPTDTDGPRQRCFPLLGGGRGRVEW